MLSTPKHLVDAVTYFNGDDLPAKVFLDKYALRDKDNHILERNPNYMHMRIAKEIARVEAKKFSKPFTIRQVYSFIKDFKNIIPQGSPMYSIGNPAYVTLSNCYVIQPPYDSYGGIHYTDQQITQICKRRGGIGTDVSELRPTGEPTANSSRTTTGIIPFVQRFSNSIREVGQNGRRGALMLTLSAHHPQIGDFISCKTDRTKVTGANISVRLTDEFLKSVEAGETYEQRWPVESLCPSISRKVDAQSVWNQIIESAWATAEPGILFWDNIIRESPADCYAQFGFRTVSTNPCSELPLSVLDSCRLLLLNLFSFVAEPFTSSAKFLFDKFYKYARIAQRLIDDIIDLELEAVQRIINKIKADPEPEHIKKNEIDLWTQVYNNCLNGRRTGTGITALGDTIAALGLRYGSAESMKLTEDIYRTLKLGCYRSSVDMAKELGAFPIWNAELENNNPFLQRLAEDDHKLAQDMKKYGRRNIALLTTPPAGTTSTVAGPRPYFGTTSGSEPAFMLSYLRNKKIAASDYNSRVDFIDETGDRWQQFEVIHPKLRLWMDITDKTDVRESPYYGSCAEEIDWKERVRMQGSAQLHVDHAISSTINLPEDAAKEDVNIIYRTAWKAGCKGITVYRKNCRTGVLVENKESCPNCKSKNTINKQGKCVSCNSCGWSLCNL
jgi:ribonucleoside-diphosphate reductase alpha chain